MPKQSKISQASSPRAPEPHVRDSSKAVRAPRIKVDAKRPVAVKAHRAMPAPDAKSKAKGAKQSQAPQRSGSKIDLVIEMLRKKAGASIDDLSKATGWQHHSVRGAISGALKKKLGLKVMSERVNGNRMYRIAK